MSVYLGQHGRISLRRKSDEGEKESTVNPADINVSRRRFSFDFETGYLLTGDSVEITSTNGAVLAFVSAQGWSSNTQQSSGKWFIHVDELGGIKLYSSFANALLGEVSTAIPLATINADIPIRVRVANAEMRNIGSVTSYELNTNRETIDTTALSEQFRSQYSGLVSGSGRIDCLWDYEGEEETANYLLQLIIRTEVGSEFDAELWLKTSEYTASINPSSLNDQLFYRISGIITNAAVAFQADNIVAMTADFVTTGPIKLLTITSPKFKLLQEDGSRISLEQDASSYLLLEQGD